MTHVIHVLHLNVLTWVPIRTHVIQNELRCHSPTGIGSGFISLKIQS